METVARETRIASSGSGTVTSFNLSLCRLVDIAASTVILLACLPALALISAVIVAESGWPVYFRQRRVGQGGHPFTMFKFRTMLAGHSGPSITAPGDERVTTVGRWLRRFKLDELPQFWNVIRGEMAIVGPRPEVPDLLAEYSESERAIMTAVRPGVTGLSALLYRDEDAVLRSSARPLRETYLDELVPQKCRIEASYLSRKNVPYDLTIMFYTALYSAIPTPRIKARALSALNLNDRTN
jgi:lipopolysaccharide/colanic/teichoic acid biosynthesis glycosyltransferase